MKSLSNFTLIIFKDALPVLYHAYVIKNGARGMHLDDETGQPLHYRMNGHHLNITYCRAKDSPVAAHYKSMDLFGAD